MTKLEEKLIELGYEHHENYYSHRLYIKKHLDTNDFITIRLSKDRTKISNAYIDYDSYYFTNQKQINNLQLAFNELQKDLEELKSCQD